MHHVAIALDYHYVGDLNGAIFRNAAHIIPPKIDEHHMLGPFLFICQEPPFHLLIFFRRDATAACAGNGTDGNDTVFATDERLRRGTNQFDPRDTEVIHIGRGIHHAQRTIELQGRRLDIGFPSLG